MARPKNSKMSEEKDQCLHPVVQVTLKCKHIVQVNIIKQRHEHNLIEFCTAKFYHMCI